MCVCAVCVRVCMCACEHVCVCIICARVCVCVCVTHVGERTVSIYDSVGVLGPSVATNTVCDDPSNSQLLIIPTRSP